MVTRDYQLGLEWYVEAGRDKSKQPLSQGHKYRGELDTVFVSNALSVGRIYPPQVWREPAAAKPAEG